MSTLRAWLDGVKSGAYRWVRPGATVLDIGCGFCESLSYLTARGCKVLGVEADTNVRRVAERYGFNVHIGLFEAKLYGPETFDYVTMSQVIEHTIDPVQTLKEIATVLKQNGFAVLSTPNPNGWAARLFGKRWINWHTPYHMQFFSEKSLKLAAEQAGYKVITNITLTSSNWIIHQLAHLVVYPKVGKPSSYWAKTKGKKPSISKIPIKLIAASRLLLIPQLLTRFFDVLQMGENRIVILQKQAVSNATPGGT
jgi:SAM-dependent methyltransferase